MKSLGGVRVILTQGAEYIHAVEEHILLARVRIRR